MTDIFPLNIFPETSLASSIVTTVWVGVTVVAFFNLRLGWVLSGLVVPGYLVPLLIAKPWSAAVVVFEGLLTYAIVWLYSEYFSGLGKWGNLFGRDRFFALFLVSVAVRIGMDGWLLPIAGAGFNDWLGVQFDYRNNLHSFGLIIVALVANQFWKSGFLRGLPPFVITIGLTYLIVRFGLMELTNFSISGINYLYEDIAASMLASPKAYIILIVTALLASRMNLHYGWDFNGILIPALLALQWYQPTKIVLSFGEAFVIYGLASWLLRAPFFQQMTIEGGRKLLLFFNVSFLYKLALGYLLMGYFPEYKTTDFFASGYLLSTLIAIKMHDKGIAARLMRATLQTSLWAVLWASVAGFSLTFLPKLWSWPMPGAPVSGKSAAVHSDDSLIDLVRQDKVAMYQSKRMPVDRPLPQELDEFARGVQRLLLYSTGHQGADLAEAKRILAGVNYTVNRAGGGLLYLREMEPRHGWGVYVIRPDAANRLAIEVPAPLDENGTAEAGAALFELLGARALAIGGSLRKANPDGTADVLRNYQTMFNVFHRELAAQDALQVRSHGNELVTALRSAQDGAKSAGKQMSSGLWVKTEVPHGVSLTKIKAMVGELPVSWDVSPVAGIQREASRGRFAELVLGAAEIRNVQSKIMTLNGAALLRERDQGITGYLLEWLLQTKDNLAASGSNLYVLPKPEELLFFDEEVLTPITRLIGQHRMARRWSADALAELRFVDAAAAVMGYEVTRYRHRESGNEYLILSERERAVGRRYWGTYVFRVASGKGYLLQVPRPIYEANSFEAGVALFESIEAEALLVAGADPTANTDHSADVLNRQLPANLFNLVNQVLLRESGARNMMTVQSRAFGVRPDQPTPASAALLAFDNGATSAPALTPLARALTQALGAAGLDYAFADGTPAATGYEVTNPQLQSLRQSANKELAVLWLSPFARSGFRQQSENRMQQAQFDAVGVPTLEDNIRHRLTAGQGQGATRAVPAGLRQALRRYLETQDVVSLHRAGNEYRAYRMERVIDRDSQRAFLLLYERQGKRIALALNLSAHDVGSSFRMTQGEPAAGAEKYVKSGAAWLEIGDAP